MDQADIAGHKLSFKQIFNFGRQIFITNFNKCDGAGRPGDTGSAGAPGVGNPRPIDPLSRPRFTILSGPDANSCASCHNEPNTQFDSESRLAYLSCWSRLVDNNDFPANFDEG